MFGYIFPHIPSLRVYENEAYKAIYCGLCKQIKKRYGFVNRLHLSYDMVFFAIFSIVYLEEKVEYKKIWCGLHPFKKKVAVKSCCSLKRAADIETIFFYFKLKDNILDSKGLVKFFNFLLLLIFRGGYKKAKKSEMETERIVSAFVEEQNFVEKKRNCSLDYYSHPTANCLGKIFENIAKTNDKKEHLYRMGYMLGKYIYLVDALDDLKKDAKEKNFNPILEQQKEEDSLLLSGKVFELTTELIDFSIAQMAEAFEKLNIKSADIMRNIIYFGLKEVKRKIIKKVTINSCGVWRS